MARFHVAASYCTGQGNPGAWSGEVEAADHEGAMAAVSGRLRSDKRRGRIGKLDMSCVQLKESRP